MGLILSTICDVIYKCRLCENKQSLNNISSEGTEAALSQVGPALFGLTGLVPPAGSSDFLCPLLNISECHLTELNNQVKKNCQYYFMQCFSPLELEAH